MLSLPCHRRVTASVETDSKLLYELDTREGMAWLDAEFQTKSVVSERLRKR